MNRSLNELQNLISEGETLVQKRPRLDEHEDLGSDEEIESQAECQKWFMKCLFSLEKNFTTNSKEYKIFLSLNKTWKVGLFETEVSFVKNDMLKQISHLEAIEWKLQNNKRSLTLSSDLNKPKILNERELTGKVKKAFVSMSFHESDEVINNYFIKILESLKISYETGEPYSNENIPTKVRTRILNSGIFILILVKRDEIKGGGYTSPSWLLKELGIAQGAGKETIALVEKNIKEFGGLNQEKELICFTRGDSNDMEKATIKFLEALKYHGLI